MKHIGMCALGLAFTLSAPAEILTWRDTRGHVQFGDRPPVGAGAKPVSVSEASLPATGRDDDSLARARRYARQRDKERLKELVSQAKPERKQPVERHSKSRKLKWRPGMAW